MKKGITIALIIVLVIGFGYFLFKISPQQNNKAKSTLSDFDLSTALNITAPRAVEADDHVMGNPSAKNTMVVYEDFECPACASYSPIVEQFTSTLTDTKVVFRHFPLPQHTDAVVAAYAAEAAGNQGKFWEMYKQLYSTQSLWTGQADPTQKFADLAVAAGVSDLNKFKADMQAKIHKDKMQKDITEGLSLKIQGTPTLYFNGTILEIGSLDQVKAQVEKLYK